MAKIIEKDGRVTSVAVEHCGQRFNVWRFERDPREYEVFCNDRGGISITFSAEDADELEADLRDLNEGLLTAERLEDKLASKIDPFLASVSQ